MTCRSSFALPNHFYDMLLLLWRYSTGPEVVQRFLCKVHTRYFGNHLPKRPIDLLFSIFIPKFDRGNGVPLSRQQAFQPRLHHIPYRELEGVQFEWKKSSLLIALAGKFSQTESILDL